MNISVQNHNSYRYEKLVLFGIIFTLLVMEWNYGRPEFTIPTILSYPGWLAGLLLPFFFLWNTHLTFSSSAHAVLNRFFFICLCLVLMLLVQWLVSPESWTNYNRFLLIQFLALPLWILVGFVYAAQPDAAKRLLGKFAMYAAYGSLFSFCLRLAGVSILVPFGVAGGPMRLFFLFGFCWYLCSYLASFMSGAKSSRYILTGLIACSLEVVFTLHKPIIWASFFSVATLLLIFKIYMPKPQFGKAGAKLLKLSTAAVLVFVAVNWIFDGIIADEIGEFISARVLHRTEEEDTISLARTAGGRVELWTSILSDSNKITWFGSGIKDAENEQGYISVHNGYLDLLFIFGIFGLTLTLYWIVFWLNKVVKSLNCLPLLLLQSSCLAYIVGILMFNAGGISRLFPGPSYFIALIFGISLRLAIDSSLYTLPILPGATVSANKLTEGQL